MTNPPSNTRRFVNAAWSLLTFQVIASVGAVGVTGWAAFHVADLVATSGEAQAPPAETTDASPQGLATDTHPPDPAAPSEGTAPPFSEVTPAASAAADAPAAAEAAPAATPACPLVDGFYRVDARLGWCDTGLSLQPEQVVLLRVSGTWSNVGPPSKGPEGFAGYTLQGTIVANADLASLVGRVGETSFPIGASQGFRSPSGGRLAFSINDTRGDFGDNEGYLSVYVAIPTNY